ncbi:MAG: molybdopterin-guanine dinucleotide biosynthesis protein B [Rhodospirillaceae bacterium]|jgi:molybdopterin-guanine dinucleotide biosynthesis adapter protein|nr:molybdopterin-guanine dinucleotide biosynthesis protein B [Rhodospirillaceae bacterium]
MKVFGLAGWSGSGKTALIARLIPEIAARGLTVSTVKHAHHEFDPDKPGKDSHAHRMAGAREVMVSSARRWALIHELTGANELSLDELIARMSPADLLLVEGFKRAPIPKLEVWREANAKPFLHPEDPHIVAIAGDAPVPNANLPVLPLDDASAIADFVLGHCRLAAA